MRSVSCVSSPGDTTFVSKIMFHRRIVTVAIDGNSEWGQHTVIRGANEPCEPGFSDEGKEVGQGMLRDCHLGRKEVQLDAKEVRMTNFKWFDP